MDEFFVDELLLLPGKDGSTNVSFIQLPRVLGCVVPKTTYAIELVRNRESLLRLEVAWARVLFFSNSPRRWAWLALGVFEHSEQRCIRCSVFEPSVHH